jgi:exodeoxyribonuclease VII small subunit
MAKKTQTPPRNFEEALEELERILAEIENGEIGLEESLAKYERGNFLIQHCRGVLSTAEKQIESLNAAPEGGGNAGQRGDGGGLETAGQTDQATGTSS